MTAQLSRERLKARCKSEIEQLEITLKNGTSDTPNLVEEELEIYRLALAGMDSEPVAWRYRYAKPGFELDWVMVEDESLCNHSSNYQIQPLYAAPQAPVAVCATGLAPGFMYDPRTATTGSATMQAVAPVAVPDDLLHMAADAIEDLLGNTDHSSSAAAWFDLSGKLRDAILNGVKS